MQLTDEQQAILQTNENIVINAVAGSGKTTTLIEYAKTRPSNKRILYLAFNRSVKTEAEQKFTAAGLKNVKVETAHSLAFDAIVKMSGYTINQGYKSYEWVELLNIATGDVHVDYMIGSHVSKFISYFCNSTAAKVQELDYKEVITDVKARQFVDNFYSVIEQFTRQALAKMYKGSIAITHDFYLKKFQLSEPKLPYDYILFDEGQDASGAMLDVFLKQPATKIIVGDVHQQIYGWRFAINSLLKTDFPFYNLSNSFRFNEEIALVANKVLEWKKYLNQPQAVKVIGAGKEGDTSVTKATLARTNLSLLMNAIAQKQHGAVKKVFFEGKISSYTFADEGASLYDILHLYNGRHEKIRDKLIAGMKSMKDLEDYIEKTEDNSLSIIADVVKEFGNELPKLINQLKENEVTSKTEADMVYSTVHRCKGMEYDEVTLLNDFINEEKLKKYIAEKGGNKIGEWDKNRLIEEVNVLYVAATRAKNKLAIPPEINPLHSVAIAQSENKPLPYKKRSSWRDRDPDLEANFNYSRYESKRSFSSQIKKTGNAGNQGKSWTKAEDDELTNLFQAGTSVSKIAAQMARTYGGIQKRLKRLGLVSDYDEFNLE
jgi:F-box protein 18 (helicase)